ncbi:MAG: hypothetical protein Q7T96_19890 [Methylobacter sp.]|nr:hypothetical protein [Methylobacter sp.]
MNTEITSFLTSEEIGHLTQTEHQFVLSRACEQLVKAGIDPNQFWHDYKDLETGAPGKRLHLPKKECLIAINDPWYSVKAVGEVLKLWNTWDQQDKDGMFDFEADDD